MARSQADLLAIQSELADDPKVISYLPHTEENDVANANLMNEVLDKLQVPRDTITGSELAAVIVKDEYRAIPAEPDEDEFSLDWLNIQLARDVVDTRAGSEVRNGILDLFPAGVTRDAFIALSTVAVNRTEDMFREEPPLLEVGGSVTSSDIADARRVSVSAR